VPNIGKAELTVTNYGARSIVSKQYGKAPLQVHTPLYLGGSSYPTMFLRTPSSGLLDGDEHQLTVELKENSRLELQTQAATLVYPGKSKQTIHVHCADGTAFKFLPHPLILAKGAVFEQEIVINLSANCRILFADHWSAGRIAMAEYFQFEAFRNHVSIFQNGKLVYCENWCLEPAKLQFRDPLICKDFTHFRTVYSRDEELILDELSSVDCVSWQMKKDRLSIIRQLYRQQ
jgi:urease accessory protein UreH